MNVTTYLKNGIKAKSAFGLCEVTLGNYEVVDIVRNDPPIEGKPYTVITASGQQFLVDDDCGLWVENPTIRQAIYALEELETEWAEGFNNPAIQEALKVLKARQEEVKSWGKSE